ncbi:MAG: transcriptional repressor LexA [Planctomycetota bacterium]
MAKIQTRSLNLTPKQMRVLQLIRDARRTHGYSPTMQELADAIGVSKVTVFEHVEALITKGVLTRDARKARSLSTSPDLVLPNEEFGEDGGASVGEGGDHLPARQLHDEGDGPVATLSFPLVGKVAAGYPIQKFEQSDTVSLVDLFGPRSVAGGKRSGNTFALRVDGMSMRDEGILDGDYVLVDQRSTARNGERVVALLPNGETTLKTFYREKDGRIRLQPANPEFAPIIVDTCEIQGIVTGVLRRY